MPYIQNVKPPMPNVTRFDLSDYNGGLNNVDSPLELANNQSPDMLNVLTSSAGIVETRPGTFKYILSLIPQKVLKMHKFRKDDLNTIVFLSCESNLYKFVITNGMPNETVTEVLYNGASIPFCLGFQYGGNFYFTNANGYFEYKASEDVVYKIIKDTGVETKGVPTYNATTKTVCYRPEDLELTDTYKGANLVNEIKLGSMELHKGRFMFTNTSYLSTGATIDIVYFTALDNVYYVPTNHTIGVEKDGEYVTHLKSFNDVLIIFKESGIKALYGNDETDFELKDVNVHVGTKHPESVQQFGNFLYYLGSDNIVYSLYDVRTDYNKMLSKAMSDKVNIFKLPVSLKETDLSQPIYTYSGTTPIAKTNHNVRAITFGNTYILSIKDKVLAFTAGSGWTLWDDLNITSMMEIEDNLIITDSEKYVLRMPLKEFFVREKITVVTGQTEVTLLKGYFDRIDSLTVFRTSDFVTKTPVTVLEKLGNDKFRIDPVGAGEVKTIYVEYISMLGYNDNGREYRSFWNSKDLDFKYPNKEKQIRKMWIMAHNFQYFQAGLKLYVLADYYETNTGVNLKTMITAFGVSLFGDRFVDRDISKSDPISVNRRCTIASFRIESIGKDKPFKVLSINGEAEIRNH